MAVRLEPDVPQFEIEVLKEQGAQVVHAFFYVWVGVALNQVLYLYILAVLAAVLCEAGEVTVSYEPALAG